MISTILVIFRNGADDPLEDKSLLNQQLDQVILYLNYGVDDNEIYRTNCVSIFSKSYLSFLFSRYQL